MPADLSSLSIARCAFFAQSFFKCLCWAWKLCKVFRCRHKKRLTIFFLPSFERLAKSINKEINYCFSNSTTAANNKKELFMQKTNKLFFLRANNMKTLQGNWCWNEKKLFNSAPMTPLFELLLEDNFHCLFSRGQCCCCCRFKRTQIWKLCLNFPSCTRIKTSRVNCSKTGKQFALWLYFYDSLQLIKRSCKTLCLWKVYKKKNTRIISMRSCAAIK